MILTDNINILRESCPQSWEKIKNIENNLDLNMVHVEPAKKEGQTLFINQGNKRVYMHSKYDPLKEAGTIVDGYKDVKDGSSVIFYGTGLGYHIEIFLKKHPNVNYYIVESVPEILYTYLSEKSLKELPIKRLKGIILGIDEQKIVSFLNNIIDKTRKDTIIVELPIHKSVFPKEYERFLDIFKRAIKNKKSELHTEFSFQKRWILNSMKNFKYIVSTPNILMEKKGHFKGKPAILVSAGPSLDDEIENLKYIKEKGLAYIFSVGSAINTLIYNDIYPHAACTYDPTVNNQKVFAKVKEQNISDIPIIFGSSVGYETLIDYPGEKYHMITSQDTVSNYYLKTEDESKMNIVFDAPTIAVVTLQLLYQLGFDPIILVGQNLAYKGKKRHSEGIEYSKDISKEEIEKGIWVKSVDGSEVLTNEGFNRMRKQMEYYISIFTGLKVINTTKGGANIEGTGFKELRDIIGDYLVDEVFDENWLNGTKVIYDKEYLKAQADKMDKSHSEALKIIREYREVIEKIFNLVKNQNFSQSENMYSKLDNIRFKMNDNDFFKTFILPMNRVNYKVLIDGIESMKSERAPLMKGLRIISTFKNFVEVCNNDIKLIDPVYKEMNEDILSFIEG
ncbi:motility associated factor glycosyltransferase family protein [Sporanaerobacter sp. PP17-6a]|uniref:motility associated factor glycosyltransferase family protein n=1 Tax=Sporanaerobacter sp. PP17-6a TaxID=1891289 RepID=UPI0008A0220C|nr:6-hydroxymethylpterin diphosphokinase MptE-like protein [Sporanaerobacter sp. PP17-6a]SCL91500.1 hypothetical protein PP176A_2149 [Sporanaerobacter sp. PP17-6a]